MTTDETTLLVLDITKSFIELLRGIEPKWNKSYFRLWLQESVSETKGSYLHGNKVETICVYKHNEFFAFMNDKGQKLMNIMGEKEGVFLLSVDSSNSYEINFEYKDLNRWKISKMDGGTDIPQGM